MEGRCGAADRKLRLRTDGFACLAWSLTVLAALVAVTSGDVAPDYKNYEGYLLLETQPLSAAQASALTRAGENWDFWEEPREGSGALIFGSPHETPSIEGFLKQLDVKFEEKAWTPPQPHVIRERRSLRAISFTQFHRLADIHEYLDDLGKLYPELVTVINIGSSLEGRDLKLVRISSSKGKSKKPAAFIDAAIHAREWIAPPVALYTILQLVENYTQNRELVDALDWYVLPVLNPDGYEYTFTNERFWRKTRSFNGDRNCLGVDANRNFGFHWGEVGMSHDPCSQTFGGNAAYTEDETQVLARFVSSIPRLRLYLTLHSYGPYLMYPWGYTTDLPEDVNELKKVADEAAAALQAVRGTKYVVGSASNVLYASSGTSRDWAKGDLNVKYVYTMELPPGGSGFDPPPDAIIPVVTETFEAIKVLGRAAAKA